MHAQPSLRTSHSRRATRTDCGLITSGRPLDRLQRRLLDASRSTLSTSTACQAELADRQCRRSPLSAVGIPRVPARLQFVHEPEFENVGSRLLARFAWRRAVPRSIRLPLVPSLSSAVRLAVLNEEWRVRDRQQPRLLPRAGALASPPELGRPAVAAGVGVPNSVEFL